MERWEGKHSQGIEKIVYFTVSGKSAQKTGIIAMLNDNPDSLVEKLDEHSDPMA